MTEPKKAESRFSGSLYKAKSTLMWLGYKKTRHNIDNSANTCQKVVRERTYTGKRASLIKKMMGSGVKAFWK